MLLRLAIKFIIIHGLFCTASYAATPSPSYALELTPVKILADLEDRIRINYLASCNSEFAGFVLRSSIDGELQMAVILKRNHVRCMGLGGMQELVVPHLKASHYAAITSMNPQVEPLYLRASPIQSLNHFRDQNQTDLQTVYTSQCGTPLGLLFQPTATGYRLGILEGRNSKIDDCNRSSKLVSYPHLNFARSPIQLPSSLEEFEPRSSFELKRVSTQLIYDKALHRFDIFYLRSCNEAPIGLVRQKDDLAMLVALYPDMPCSAKGPHKLWTKWSESLPANSYRPSSLSFSPPASEKLSLVRPISYSLNKGQIEVRGYESCQKHIGMVSRSSKLGYAVGILQTQDSLPCNSPFKQVTYSYSWSFDDLNKRDVKPLQLVDR